MRSGLHLEHVFGSLVKDEDRDEGDSSTRCVWGIQLQDIVDAPMGVTKYAESSLPGTSIRNEVVFDPERRMRKPVFLSNVCASS